MDTIRLTGPGLISKIVSKYLCSENDGFDLTGDLNHGSMNPVEVTDSYNSKKKILENITIFPYYFLNPVPNTYTTELNDEKSMSALKLKYTVTAKSEIDNIKFDENAIEKRKCDGDANRTDAVLCTYAIHWWQRSWQEKIG